MKDNNFEIDFSLIYSNIIAHLKKYWKFQILFIFISLLVSLYLCTLTRYYETHMTAYSDVLPDSKLADLLEDISESIKKEDYELLSEKLKLQISETQKIKKMTIDFPKDETSLKEHYGVKVKVRVLDRQILPKLEKSMAQYVNNLPYIKARTGYRRTTLESSIQTTKNEIKSLEIIRENIANSYKNNTLKKDIYLSDVGVASSKIIELSNNLADLEIQLNSMSDFQIVKGFSQSKVYSGPDLRLYIAGAVLFLMISLNLLVYFIYK